LLTQTVLDTWDPDNPSRPRHMGYAGSEDSIRTQFEEYILSLLSSMAYQIYHESLVSNAIPASVANIPDHFPDPGDTAGDFNPEFLAMWRSTHNFELFDKLTSGNRIFDIIEPRHPTAGGLGVDDLQRRFAQGVAELHLDDRVREGREQLGRTWQTGRERVEAGLRGVWAEVERARQQRQAKRRSEGQVQARGQPEVDDHTTDKKENRDPGAPTSTSAAAGSSTLLSTASSTASSMVVFERDETSPEKRPTSPPESRSSAGAGAGASNPTTTTTATGGGGSGGSVWSALAIRDRAPKVDTAQIQASARESAVKAGAYFSSWGSWAKERLQQQQQQQQQQQSTKMAEGSTAAQEEGGGGGRTDGHNDGMEASRRSDERR
jgi:hypothetical protein